MPPPEAEPAAICAKHGYTQNWCTRCDTVLCSKCDLEVGRKGYEDVSPSLSDAKRIRRLCLACLYLWGKTTDAFLAETRRPGAIPQSTAREFHADVGTYLEAMRKGYADQSLAEKLHRVVVGWDVIDEMLKKGLPA